MSDLAVQLNALVVKLRQPSLDLKDRKSKFAAVSYYLPLIKNRQNLWLVLQELSLSPNLFEGGGIADIPLISYAVDSVSYAQERKSQVTAPTLTTKQWEAEMTQVAFNLPPLFGMIITAGLVNANVPIVPELLKLVDAVSQSPDMIPAIAACLVRAQWSYRFTKKNFSQIRHSTELLAVVVNQLLYTQQSVNLSTPPISTELGGWSRLISGLLTAQPFQVLLEFLDTLQIFVRTLVSLHELPEAMKPVFFGVLIQLEGVVDQILANPALHHEQRALLVIATLEILQPLGFVVEEVGSKFESYQFVYNACLDALGSRNFAARAIAVLGKPWSCGQTVKSIVSAGDLVFFFSLSEQLMPVLPPVDAEQLVLQIAHRFIDHYEVASVYEAAHSVMLAYLATHPGFKYSSSLTAVGYFDQVMQLFPKRLNSMQFQTAVGAIMKAVDAHAANHVLQALFNSAKMSMPGQRLPWQSQPARDPASTAPTLRSALVAALLHAAADNCEPADLQRWLTLISPMVPQPYSLACKEEREFMIKDFSDVVTSLKNEVVDVGIKWFFNGGWASKL